MVLLWDIGSLVGVNEISTVSKAAISPNPSRDMITISTNGSDREEYYFEIISSSGKIMKSGELLNQNSIDISELPAA
ncbi:MAG: T9SS type A sorting domain-containing protein [Bacteroidetes bacterium]|nr:T9SS type A sorting domain-containing protein [Bacteroidota bacterium]